MYQLKNVVYQNSVSGETVMVITYPDNRGFWEYDADVPEHWRKAYWKEGDFILLECEEVFY